MKSSASALLKFAVTLCGLMLLLLIVVLFRAHESRDEKDTPSTASHEKTGKTVAALPAPVASMDGGAEPPQESVAAGDNEGAPKNGHPATAKVEDRYATAVVLDEREEKAEFAGRPVIRRLRLVRDDSFKYPLLRVEDDFSEESGARVLVNQTAMVADHVMVTVKDAKTNGAALEEQLKSLGASVRRKMPASGVWLVAYPDPNLDTVTQAREALGKMASLVRYTDPDYIAHASVIPNDSSFGNLWGMHNTGQSAGTADADIDAPEAWDMHTGSAAVKVGVIDTGIDHTHPDLAANMWTNPNEVAGNGIDDDGNGYVDDVRGWDFVNNDNIAMDDNNHGTHCAGTIGGAGNNGQGVAGVCWTVSLIPLKFLNAGGSGATSDAVEAVAYGNLIGLHMTSNSWGGGGFNQALKDQIDAAHTAGILFVAAAGNSNSNNDVVQNYPSNYDSPCVLAVASTTRTDGKSSFSSYGLTTVELGAPGSDIYSTVPGGGYASFSGTSMATPHVSGACALLKASKPSLTHMEIKDVIMASVDVTPAMTGITVTGGRLNVHKALLMLDDLTVSPSVIMVAKGSVGGPFTPTLQTYTLTNTDATTPLNWTAAPGAPWISVSPAEGTLAAGASTTVSLAFNDAVNALPAATHAGSAIFTNTTSGVSITRGVSLAVGQVDHFTELFTSNNDTDNQSWLFTPDGSDSFYSVLRTAGVTTFPTDPTAGTNLTLSDDSFSEVTPGGGRVISLYGVDYPSFFVSSNGNLTFGTSDSLLSESLENHFLRPRIAALFDDLNPATGGGRVSWLPLADRVAVTYENIPQYSGTDSNSFQIELFTDGRIRITCLGIAATDGLIGLSRGLGVPSGFVSSDFNSYPTTPPPPVLRVTVPGSVTEGAGVLAGQGTVTLPAAATADTVVTLSSSNLGELTVPASVTVLSGQTSATFDLTVIDDALLDGTRVAVISANSSGYVSAGGAVAVQDNDGTAVITLTAPASVTEGVGTVQGTVSLSFTPTVAVTVGISSSDPTAVTVPGGVVIPAGQNSTAFAIEVVNDTKIDGLQSATITASVAGWTGGTADVAVLDNETTNLAITLPATVTEGASGTATVSISGTLPAPLVVTPVSDTTTRLTVPATVTIPAGSTSATFTLTAPNNTLTDGSAIVNVAVSAAGFTGTNANTTVLDNDLHHFVWNTIAATQTRGVPFSVTITAKDVNEVTIASYTSPATLSAAGTGGALTMTPTTTGAFTSGVWTGNVTVNTFDPAVVLTATNAGKTGVSNTFNVTTGSLASFTWDTQAGRIRGANVNATVTARDLGGNTVTGFNGTASLSGYIPNPAHPGIVITELNPDTPDAVEFTNVSGGSVNIGGWTLHFYDFDTGGTSSKSITIPAGTSCAPGQVFRVTEFGTAPGTFPNLNAGVNLNWTSAAGSPTAVLVRDSSGNLVDFMCAAGLQASAITSPVTIPAEHWSGAAITAPSNSLHTYLRTGGVDTQTAADWARNTNSMGTLNSGLVLPFPATVFPVTITPLATSSFTAGVWSGSMTVLQTASQMRFRADSGTSTGVSNPFDVTGTLSLGLPPSAAEGDAPVTATLAVSHAPAGPLVFTLSSSDPTAATVPATVTLPAGETSVTFPVTIVDDTAIDGTQATTVTAQLPGWTNATASLSVLDNETLSLALFLPVVITEGSTVTGTVSASGAVASDLVVTLTSDSVSRLTVPATVTIASGTSSTTFNVVAVENALSDGSASVTVSAGAAGYAGAGSTVSVRDNDVHHFGFAAVPSPQTKGVPFSVSVTAYDLANNVLTSYSGAPALVAAGAGGGVAISPTNVNGFVNGVWTGQVTAFNTDTGVVLSVNDGLGHAGDSDAFDVMNPTSVLTVVEPMTPQTLQPGQNPRAQLVVGPDGALYGTTVSGGASNQGSIFKITTAGVVTTLANFYGYNGMAPNAGLILASDGHFYGTTTSGGANNLGTVFRMTPSGTLTTLAHLTTATGGAPRAPLMQALDGHFYGTTSANGNGSGTIFRMTSSGVITVLVNFSGTSGSFLGSSCQAGLIQAADGNLYGVTSTGGNGGGFGTIFRVTTSGTFTSLRSFTGTTGATLGSAPLAALVQASDGALYGTTNVGGTGNFGTIFKITTAGTFTNLLSFTGTTGANLGTNPQSALVQWATDGALYGMTVSGGVNNNGTLFKVTTAGALTTVRSLSSTADGANPYGALTLHSDGSFYATCNTGGSSQSRGAVIKLTPSTGTNTFSRIYSFFISPQLYRNMILAGDDNFYAGQANGAAGLGSLVKATQAGVVSQMTAFTSNNFGGPYVLEGADGDLYGSMPTEGGSGQIFRMTKSGTKTTLADLTGTSGAAVGSTVIHGMIQASDGNLYGVTSGGGTGGGFGTMFQVTPAGVFTSLVSFTGNSGANPGNSPQTRLVEDSNGDLWGTTASGGSFGIGTVFKVSKSGAFTSLVQFTGSTGAFPGANPNSNLLLASDGNFYGTTNGGGTGGLGTVFRVTPDGTFTSLVSFTGSGGAFPGTTPSSRLVQGTDGHLYGTTTGGGTGSGTVYRVALPSGAFTSLVQFSGNTGATPGGSPHATLLQAADGYFYGTTTFGGFYGLGTVFRVNASGAFQSLYAFGTNNDGGSPNINGSSSFSDSFRLLTGPDGYLYGANASTIFRVHQQPAIQAVSVSGVDPTSATLNGIVLPNQDAAGVYFQYGLSSSFGSQTVPQNIAAGTEPVAVNAALTGLQSGAVYYWRMVTVTSQGAFYSAVQSFATPGAPLAITGSWVTAGQTSITLDGTVNPLGSSTDWYFEYGTTTAYGSQTVTQNAGAGIANVLVNSTITGLLPGTTYQVRLVATNATGTSFGDAQAITTLPVSTAVLQPQAQFINTGTAPLAGLYKAPDGQIYGTTNSGGTYGSAGTVFRVSQGGSLTTVANLYSTGNGFGGGSAPQSRLVQAGDGNFYGTTNDGGTTSNFGTVFRLTPDGQVTVLVRFNSTGTPRGADPSCGLTLGPDGSLYGVTQGGGSSSLGTVFKVTTSGVLSTLVNFTGTTGTALGSSPRASLVLASDGNFYGTTATGGSGGFGTIFRLTPAGALTTLVQFTGTAGTFPGATPTASLIQGADGHLYGTTATGGANNFGTVFQVTLGAGFTSLVSFSGTTGSALGSSPKGALAQLADGTLYGTTQTGGLNNLGTVFSITPAGLLTTLISFSGTTGTLLGSSPQGELVEGTDGALYGTTNGGGLNNNGTIFKITPQGLLTTLVHLSAAPNLGRLAQGGDGRFFGATLGGGGAVGAGTLQAGLPGEAPVRLATLSPVSGTTALNARAGLFAGPDGNFYGTTAAGGAINLGSVFKLTPAGVLTTLISFTGNSGANPGSGPQAPLILGADGNYLGTTSGGGTGGFGSVFRMTPAGVQTTLISFTGTTGANLGSSPQAPLLLASDGNYYGATTAGGSTGFGTVFRLTPAGALTTLATFSGTLGTTLGSSPSGLLVQGADGAIYGTTNGGGLSSAGTVFRITTGGVLTTLASFTGNAGDQPGSGPVGGLQAAPDGCFYGLTSAGGAYGLGTVFRVAPDGSVTSLHAFSGRQDGVSPAQGLALGADGYLYGGNGTAFFRLRQPPVVLASPASLITESTATLNGSITGETHSGTVQFEYGETPAYGNSTPAVNFSPGTAAETVFAPLVDLQPYQTYHYRLVATTAAGVFASPNRTFTTSSNATFDTPDDVPVVSDGFDASGRPLSLTLGFAPTQGTLLTLVNNTGFTPVRGAFSGLPEGGTVSVSFGGQSYLFQITYAGGDGNDITLELVTQSITFPAIPAKRTTDGPFALAATASSGLPVSYEITAGAASATLSGNTVTLTGTPGTVTIRASQAGDGGAYGSAKPVTQTFVVLSTPAYTHISSSKGASSVIARRADGTLWAWGQNSDGQLGLGNISTQWVPVQVGTATDWAQVSNGGYHSVAVRGNGTLWAAGDNFYGQIGDGTTTDRTSFVQVGTATNWLVAVAGLYHTLAIKTDGTLWAWGYNSDGQLGQGTTGTTANSTPLQVGTLNTWSAVAAGAYHSLARRQDGTFWAFGDNLYGQIGNGSTTDATSPVQIATMTNCTSFTAGYYFSAAVRADGTLWTWGRNLFGQIGDGTLLNRTSPIQVGTATNWQQVRAGADHVLAVRTGGTLWAWGRNLNGQLGQGYTRTDAAGNVPVQVGVSDGWQIIAPGHAANVAMKADGTLWSWGENGSGQLGYRGHLLKPVAAQFGPVADAAAGDGHGAILRQDGTLWTFGNNGNGQLGNGLSDSAQRPVPSQPQPGTQWLSIATGGLHTAAVRGDGTLWTWGANGDGQLGDGTTTQRTTPGQVGSDSNWLKVTAGRSFTVALRAGGTLWAWGYNSDGQMGNGVASSTDQLLPMQIGTASDWADVVSGGYHVLARKQDGTLWAWGYNFYGQLGDGTTTNRSTPVQIGTNTSWARVSAGWHHTVATQADGSLWGWGNNSFGQLGDGSYTSRSTPVQIAAASSWKDVAAGSYHTVAIRADRTLWSWGYNFYGQLGDGGTSTRNTPAQLGTADGWGRAFASNYSTLVSTQDGSLWSCGFGTRGGIGLAWRDAFTPALVLPGLAPVQTVDFPAPGDTPVGNSVVLEAASSSGLPVNYIVDGPATLDGSRVTVTGPGVITLYAWQPGDDYHQSSQMMVRYLNAPAPAVTTLAATAVGTTTATLNGIVNPNGTLTSASFQHGVTNAYGTTTAVTLSPANGSTAQNVSVTLTGLLPGTTYHFRLTGTNPGGDTNGASLTFSTISTDATLSGLSVSPGAVYPAFASTTFNVTAGVPNAATSFTVTPVTSHSTASVMVNGTPVASGAASDPIAFSGATATVNLLVTAGDGTTTQAYTIAVSRYAPFGEWSSGSGMAGGNTGPSDDYDGDGIANLLEYALGASPTTATNSLLPATTNATNPSDGEHYLTISYRRRIVPGTLTYRLQRSITLAGWEDIPANNLEQLGSPVPTGDGITELVTFRVHPSIEDSSEPGFIRLRVTDN
jgi:uncharacterized repeat protein (TIGR03803 family)